MPLQISKLLTAVTALIQLPILAFAGSDNAQLEANPKPNVCPEFLNHSFRKLHSSEDINLCTLYTGGPLLIVNTASHCGFTPQFKGLEALYQKYKNQGLHIVGFASNDFKQAAKNEKKAAEICYQNFGVSFTMLAQTNVRGKKANPVFQYLASLTHKPSWNFNKYLILPQQNQIVKFGSRTQPLDSPLENAIKHAVNQKPTAAQSKDMIILTHKGDSADIHLNGAHISSWVPKGAKTNQLYLSQYSHFAEGKAIRGGVPILFPQFGSTGHYIKHGFARIKKWTYIQNKSTHSTAVFQLTSSPETKKIWPFDFNATYSVTLHERRLHLTLNINNTGESPIEFTAGLHSYFSLSHISQASVEGLLNTQYRDEGEGPWHRQQTHSLTIQDEINRVYLDSTQPILLKSKEKTLKISQIGFTNTVIWNPWQEIAKAIDDMGNTDYKNFLCIEPAIFDAPKQLAPGEHWTGEQKIEYIPSTPI